MEAWLRDCLVVQVCGRAIAWPCGYKPLVGKWYGRVNVLLCGRVVGSCLVKL